MVATVCRHQLRQLHIGQFSWSPARPARAQARLMMPTKSRGLLILYKENERTSSRCGFTKNYQLPIWRASLLSLTPMLVCSSVYWWAISKDCAIRYTHRRPGKFRELSAWILTSPAVHSIQLSRGTEAAPTFASIRIFGWPKTFRLSDAADG